MANCPKCGRKLRLTDWRQNCPGCGANILMYDVQERLMKDADKAEVQNYHFQKKLDRLKGSFIGSKLAIARIVTSIIPIFALLLPIVNMKAVEPFYPYEGPFGIISIFGDILDNFDVNALLGLISGSPADKAVFFSVALLLLSVVLLLLHVVFLTLACSPHGKIRNFIFDISMLVTAAAAAGCFAFAPEGGKISGSLSWGTLLYLLLLTVNFVIDYLTYKQGIEINHKPCFVGGIPIEEYFDLVEQGKSEEEIRKEMYKRLKAIQAEKDREIAVQDAEERERIMEILSREDVKNNPLEDENNYRHIRKAEEKKAKAKKKLALLENKSNAAKGTKYIKKINRLKAQACTLTGDDIAKLECRDEKERAAAEYELFYFKSNLARSTGGRIGALTLVLLLVFAACLPVAVNGIIRDTRWNKRYEELTGITVYENAEDAGVVLPEGGADELVGYSKFGNDNIVLFMFVGLACLALAIYTFGRDRKTVKYILDGTYHLEAIQPQELKIFTTEGKIQYRVKYILDGIEENQFVSECAYKMIQEDNMITCIVAGANKSAFAQEGYVIPCVNKPEKEVAGA
ncbi:MAG: hypothetical protein MJ177_02545 [Clostridia bacterium]|nr:hypothetical protein [Clostridia bacterium]